MDWIIPRHQADYSQHTRCDFARDLFTGVVTNISLSCKWLDLYWRAAAVFIIPTCATNTLHTTQTVGGRNAKKVNFYCLLVWGISLKPQPWFFRNLGIKLPGSSDDCKNALLCSYDPFWDSLYLEFMSTRQTSACSGICAFKSEGV